MERDILRKALIDRIKMFTGKDFFLDSIYETEELEDFHDHILDYETLMDEIEKNTREVSPGHRPVPWNRATLEQIHDLREYLKELF